jgi:hypothetical protein
MDGDAPLRVDWGDGVSALDRTQRAIVMATDAAIGRLLGLGYRRSEIEIRQVDGDQPVVVELALYGEAVYRVMFIVDPRGPLGLVGQWVKQVKPRGWRRLLFWRK